jgi:hypothetical protein
VAARGLAGRDNAPAPLDEPIRGAALGVSVECVFY